MDRHQYHISPSYGLDLGCVHLAQLAPFQYHAFSTWTFGSLNLNIISVKAFLTATKDHKLPTIASLSTMATYIYKCMTPGVLFGYIDKLCRCHDLQDHDGHIESLTYLIHSSFYIGAVLTYWLIFYLVMLTFLAEIFNAASFTQVMPVTNWFYLIIPYHKIY